LAILFHVGFRLLSLKIRQDACTHDPHHLEYSCSNT
jgi:hypothetical protein